VHGDVQNSELLGMRGKEDSNRFWILTHGPPIAIEEGFQASDVCVTRKVMLSGRTHCRNNHRFTPQTTRWRHGTRICLICAAERKAKAREARKTENRSHKSFQIKRIFGIMPNQSVALYMTCHLFIHGHLLRLLALVPSFKCKS
jgi:hypothetical protein